MQVHRVEDVADGEARDGAGQQQPRPIRTGRCQSTPTMIAVCSPLPNRIHSMALSTPY